MSKRRTSHSRIINSAIAVMNLCVLGTFVAILFPAPEPMYIQPVANVASQRLVGPAQQKINLGIPTRVVVASMNIDLPVRTGSYDQASNTWTLDTQSAFYADRSVPVNDSNGTTLIYGHARQGLFAMLPNISTGATAEVYTDTGKIFSYSFSSNHQVTPDDTSVFVDSGAPILALQTCSGPFDTYRTLVSFNFTGVTSQ
ncbi:MAG: peptidase sortase [Candidatus Saccharibacteria bacterium]|nr:peptidase sortase [Candidatus Saccharibacteria bacterium]MDB5180476.1 peptidase sortase [Candidatus Saccharibacteria bacterium]